jgi:hypothetical protein
MALVDRYLQAVKFWLSGNQKDDIIAELSEDLRSQIEEKETELGRKLTDAEVEPILKRCGSPMAVAERYMPQRSAQRCFPSIALSSGRSSSIFCYRGCFS